MNENKILCKIFDSGLQIEDNKYIVNTKYGTVTITTDITYPKTLPEVQYNFFDKTHTEKIKSSNFITMLDKLKGKYCIYSIVYMCLSIIENKHNKDIQLHLEEVQEIDEKMFLEWKSSRTKPHSDKFMVKGKLYFQKMIDKKNFEL